jgi:phosphoribosylformylglycinamidine cyclo-ligase
MHRTFNCGIGMVVIVAAEHAQTAIAQLTAAGETVHHIGSIRTRAADEEPTIINL